MGGERGQLKTLEKTSRSREEIKQQTQPTIYGVEDGIVPVPHWWKASFLTAVSTKIIAYQFCNPVLQTNSQEELLNALTKCDQINLNFECIVTKCICDPKYSQNINQAKLGIADHVLGFLGKV